MPENPAGLGHEKERLVHFKKIFPESKKCGKCGGYEVGVKKHCPRCIAKGIVERIQETEILFYCMACGFRCLPASYETYWKTSQRFVCQCNNRLDSCEVSELAITKIF
ncbi:MAG: hypothetical protein A2374_03065 [Candidatus Moranbacteria bacterium RIFOXYB1_FULL_44_23]|nr:MAG: hypothetical protein UW19_C0023G0009 [Candidatus Moranbacteria bacterium GW2011_GWF2_44_10]OGI36909.1 MAG: hypothetical protein A2407_01910 [Candidatus Moranbacteria bacterium RIFOXYC1_FULL_44_8]OGI39480.1 MAG: hypothetical protein A2374_03065 [Candidatus Moranbacteria bacterium RIFOXYB1_FULL_44_23]OGI42997.1 MAG: hypothetical protein A2593_02605 [Candidatus Moranbacteria bacterium RIFOXYD1_FULL_44_9]HBB36562.1 hypothetical protein [Candidatus Moranbacteria bacterium]